MRVMFSMAVANKWGRKIRKKIKCSKNQKNSNLTIVFDLEFRPTQNRTFDSESEKILNRTQHYEKLRKKFEFLKIKTKFFSLSLATVTGVENLHRSRERIERH